MRIFSHKKRPVHLGPFALEALARTDQVPEFESSKQQTSIEAKDRDNPLSLTNAISTYLNVFDRMRVGEAADQNPPIPDSLEERSNHLKAACYYLDASMAGTCKIPQQAILETPVVNNALNEDADVMGSGITDNAMAAASVKEGHAALERAQAMQTTNFDHKYALVIVQEFTREPKKDEPGGDWLVGTQVQRAAVRVAEAAAVMANYLRMLGFEATMHTGTASDLDFNQILVHSGLGMADGSAGSDAIVNPYLQDQFGMAIVSTNMELAADKPLAKNANKTKHGFSWWLGLGGTRPGYQGKLYKNRAFHLGPHKMEKLKRIEEPTTLIDEDKVPRVPKRNDMFIRAAMGDLGPKAKKELDDFRMITKSPFGHALQPPLGAMVPLQFGKPADEIAAGTDNPKQNAEAVKAALYYLGTDMVGVCEIPDYAWYSHDLDGSEIKPYHKNAISILVDQGYETMEGASGDDWISGAQSMRAYLRAQLYGCVVATHIRSLGYSATVHSVLQQDVLHIPLILKAGLGEMSRIGELVLNPFVGPRFKSGIITTDMPLEADKPIDFGLQDFCSKCTKCARECPCSAIPFGKKIMFNGYEMWKQDTEKCARYRITNSAGALCGRCMKTCPYNIEGVLAEKPFLWAAMNLPFTREWIAKLDDKVGNGNINPIKKWWWDHDADENGKIIMAKKTNARPITFRKSLEPDKQKLACYPQDIAGPAVSEAPVLPDRKLGVEKYKAAESPESYKARMNP
jgi:reductive dehalogenase